ncbi:sigma-54-dependent Fis family transcriptional regulator, partial [Mycobacterium tuberculosis]|nr:sigma-54-dependent Fis family transcriptional regulator [Mycobacterium tuberculosis]
VSDIRLPGMDGMALMARIRALDAELPVVLITGHGDVSLAVQAMKEGAHDFIEKPFAPDYLVDVVRRALEKRALTREVRELRQQLRDIKRLRTRIIGRSPAIERLRTLVSELADTRASVLISGETGTGKELVARCLHDASPRRAGNFVALNCGGMPESLVDSEIFGHEAG